VPDQTPRPGRSTVVVALGGNAILQPGQVGTFEEQLLNIDDSARRIARIAAAGHEVVVVHGNGPQVGNILIQQAAAEASVAPMPMDVCGSMSQGQVGYLLCQCLENHLRRLRRPASVGCLVTETVVSERDPAFANPSKPVGPFYSEERARTMMLENGFAMKEDAGRGWRRVVPSPEPVEIVQLPSIKALVEHGDLVVCVGGGGIPVLRARDGSLSGTAAVIDKDLAAARLALDLHADVLLVLTDVQHVFVDYRGPRQRALDHVSADEMRAYAAAGHFKAGSMGLKVEACLRVAEAGGRGVVASLLEALEALDGKAGTTVTGKTAAAGNGKRTAGSTAAGGDTATDGGAGKASARAGAAKGSGGAAEGTRRGRPDPVLSDTAEAKASEKRAKGAKGGTRKKKNKGR
jgi:carbamate kinase